MDKGTFASYKFKPSDVIEGLNRYFAETKAYRYLRASLEIRNGEFKSGDYYVIRNIVFDVGAPKIKESGYYYLICDPEEVVGVAINWLREEHDIFYTPGMKVPIEDFDVDEASKEYEKATRKDRIEELQESRRDLIEALQRRLYEAKRRIVALEKGHTEKTKIIDRQVTRIKELEEQLRVLRYDILKVYREIFDCSNGDPEGTDEETLNDILTEYKRTLGLKNVAEEKTIKYKELARENEENLAREREWTKRMGGEAH